MRSNGRKMMSSLPHTSNNSQNSIKQIKRSHCVNDEYPWTLVLNWIKERERESAWEMEKMIPKIKSTNVKRPLQNRKLQQTTSMTSRKRMLRKRKGNCESERGNRMKREILLRWSRDMLWFGRSVGGTS